MIANRDTVYRDELAKLTPGLRRFARALVENHGVDAADDLVQAALLAALSEGQERRGIRLNMWLLTTCVANHRRSLRVATADRQVNAGSGAGQATTGSGRWEPHRAFPPRSSDLLSDLPLECREVFLLVVLEELTYGQAAECLGTTLNAVIVNLAKARENMGRRTHSRQTTSRSLQGEGQAGAVPYLRVVK